MPTTTDQLRDLERQRDEARARANDSIRERLLSEIEELLYSEGYTRQAAHVGAVHIVLHHLEVHEETGNAAFRVAPYSDLRDGLRRWIKEPPNAELFADQRRGAPEPKAEPTTSVDDLGRELLGRAAGGPPVGRTSATPDEPQGAEAVLLRALGRVVR